MSCTTSGSSPPATITWWKDGKFLEASNQIVSLVSYWPITIILCIVGSSSKEQLVFEKKLSVLKKLLVSQFGIFEFDRIGRKQSFDVTTSIQIYFRYPKIKMLQCLKWELQLPTKIMAKTWHVKQKMQRWPTKNFLGRKSVSNLMCYVSKLI